MAGGTSVMLSWRHAATSMGRMTSWGGRLARCGLRRSIYGGRSDGVVGCHPLGGAFGCANAYESHRLPQPLHYNARALSDSPACTQEENFVRMPDFDSSDNLSGRVTAWYKQEGDWLQEEDALCEVSMNAIPWSG